MQSMQYWLQSMTGYDDQHDVALIATEWFNLGPSLRPDGPIGRQLHNSSAVIICFRTFGLCFLRCPLQALEHLFTPVNNLSSRYGVSCLYKESEAIYRRALEGSEKVLRREHPSTLTSVSNLGSVLDSQGKYEEAEAIHRRDLEGSEKVLGHEHPDTLTSVSKLGNVLYK
jgi:hypothetical protein